MDAALRGCCVSLCVYIHMFVCVYFSSKSNYHWKVAALLANAKCFVLLCSRLIGWLKYKTPTNALLCCNVLVWEDVFVRVCVWEELCTMCIQTKWKRPFLLLQTYFLKNIQVSREICEHIVTKTPVNRRLIFVSGKHFYLLSGVLYIKIIKQL